MHYLCLVHDEHGRVAALAERERQALLEEQRAYDAYLGDAGYLVAAGGLGPTGAAALVRCRSGVVSVSAAGPSPDQPPVVAFLVLDARDLVEAAQLAGRMPVARHGSVRVLPVAPFS